MQKNRPGTLLHGGAGCPIYSSRKCHHRASDVPPEQGSAFCNAIPSFCIDSGGKKSERNFAQGAACQFFVQTLPIVLASLLLIWAPQPLICRTHSLPPLPLGLGRFGLAAALKNAEPLALIVTMMVFIPAQLSSPQRKKKGDEFVKFAGIPRCKPSASLDERISMKKDRYTVGKLHARSGE